MDGSQLFVGAPRHIEMRGTRVGDEFVGNENEEARLTSPFKAMKSTCLKMHKKTQARHAVGFNIAKTYKR